MGPVKTPAVPDAAPGADNAKWQRVRRDLLDLIERLPAGDPLPPERELARDLAVARMTLRKAMDELVAADRLVRRPGRGTFVAPGKLSYPTDLTSFSEDMRRRGRSPSSRTVDFAVVAAAPDLAGRLRSSLGTAVVRAVRLRLADGEPMGVERLHVPQSLVPGLTAEDLERHSFYFLLKHRWGVVQHSGTRIVEATCAGEEDSRLLGIPLDAPAFSFERTTYDPNGAVIEFVTSTYRGDRWRFVTHFGPNRSPATYTEPLPALGRDGWGDSR